MRNVVSDNTGETITNQIGEKNDSQTAESEPSQNRSVRVAHPSAKRLHFIILTLRSSLKVLGHAGILAFISGVALTLYREQFFHLFYRTAEPSPWTQGIIYFAGPVLLTLSTIIAALRYLKLGGYSIDEDRYVLPERRKRISIPLRSQINAFNSSAGSTELESEYDGPLPLSPIIERDKFRIAIEEQCNMSMNRLSEEISALSRRGNLNLVIGIFISLGGIIFLGWKMINAPTYQASDRDLLAYFVPRTAFVILIEVVAFFFLNLYRTSLNEIKYFQNELTNIEARVLAISLMCYPGDIKPLSKLASNLLKTERNFVLQKGQTTVDLERERLIGSILKDNAAALKQIFDRKTRNDT